MRATPGVRLLTVECAFGGTPFELGCGDAILQVRAAHPLWLKENLLNIGWARVDTPYVAWIDGDVLFRRSDWANEAIAVLHDHSLIQPWSSAYNVDKSGQPTGAPASSFAKVHQHGYAGACGARCCHTGYAWAARREVLEATHGLLEDLIVGGADHLMAAALFNRDRDVWTSFSMGPYPERVNAWCRNYADAVKQNIGHVDGDIHHLFHGNLIDRQYGARHAMTAKHGFDASVHLRKNADGVNQIVDLPELGGEVREYFQNRREDGGAR